MDCIFEGRPPECTACMDALLLQCLRQHRYLVLTEVGKGRMLAYVAQEVSNPDRYKTESGRAQRRDGGQ